MEFLYFIYASIDKQKRVKVNNYRRFEERKNWGWIWNKKFTYNGDEPLYEDQIRESIQTYMNEDIASNKEFYIS